MRIFSPKRYVASVDRIDLNTLWADGKRAILLDRDNTLVPRDTEQVPPRFPPGSMPPAPKALSCAWCPTTGIATRS